MCPVVDEWMNKLTIVHQHNEILIDINKEWHAKIYHNMDEPSKHAVWMTWCNLSARAFALSSPELSLQLPQKIKTTLFEWRQSQKL